MSGIIGGHENIWCEISGFIFRFIIMFIFAYGLISLISDIIKLIGGLK